MCRVGSRVCESWLIIHCYHLLSPTLNDFARIARCGRLWCMRPWLAVWSASSALRKRTLRDLKELGVTLRPCGDLRPENAMENHEIWDLNREKTIILLGEVDDFPLSGNQEIIVHCHGAVPEGKPDHFHHLCHASTAACNTEISARTWMDFAVCLERIYKGIWDMSWYGNLSKIDLIFF